jgi:DNA mismatch endonuclease (patch repair protein)
MTGKSIRSRAPTSSSALVRKVMVANYGGNTAPERTLRAELFRVGLRFRKNRRPLPSMRCSADIVFPKLMVCVFVDGCFWHGCPRHFRCPNTNSAWWHEKIEANKERDKRQRLKLKAAGWRAVGIWEHDLGASRVEHTVNRIIKVLNSRSLDHSKINKSI